MKNNRRDFLKFTGLTGIGLAGSGMLPGCTPTRGAKSNLANIQEQVMKKHTQRFNMHGYAASKLDTVRVGVIGIGVRGSGTALLISHIEGVDIKAVCDIVPEKVESIKTQLAPLGFRPDTYSGKEDAWKQMCDRDDIDLIYIITPWALHTPIAVYAMEHGKHVVTEIPAGQTIDECWQLVETAERTRKHCMMLENCCYDFFRMLTLNMVRQGFFGEIIHGEGAYIHDRFKRVFDKSQTTWRLKENINRNGNLYPTHGFGPICQVMNINNGDKLEYMVSMSSNDFMLGKMADKLAETDDFWKPFAHQKFRGNMNVSTIRTTLGRTIMVQHDTTSPRVYSNIHLVSGTKGSALEYPLPPKITTGEEWLSDEEYKKLEEKYTPFITKKMAEVAKQLDPAGHGGIDLLINWRLIDCLRNGLPLDMSVYDAAAFSCIEPLSEWSVANRSNSIDIPDFTCGAWKTNQPLMDIALQGGGGTTKVKA
ncbi:MAG: Gfo/Idh/MocA family oxidoreductase [Ginsengibacter sp.]